MKVKFRQHDTSCTSLRTLTLLDPLHDVEVDAAVGKLVLKLHESLQEARPLGIVDGQKLGRGLEQSLRVLNKPEWSVLQFNVRL